MHYLLIFIILSSSIFAKDQFLMEMNKDVIPSIDQRVVIPSSKLDDNEKEELLTKVRNLEKSHKVVLQILALETISPLTIDEALLIAKDKLPLGKNEKEMLVLILIAFEQREIKIHYGASLSYSKSFQKNLIANTIVPHLKENKLPEMIKAIIADLEKHTKPIIPLNKPRLTFDIDLKDFATLNVPFDNYRYYLNFLIFLFLYPFILKFFKSGIFTPLLTSTIFSVSTYILYPDFKTIILCFIIGFLMGAVRSLNSILFFLSNSDRGHKYKINSKRYSLWVTKQEEIIGGGISGRLDD